MSFFGLFSSAPVVRFPHAPALGPAMQAAIYAAEGDGPGICPIEGLNAAEIVLVRRFVDPLNRGYTLLVGPVGAPTHLITNCQCVTDLTGSTAAERHWDDKLELKFAREEDRIDFELEM